jgi:redox-sensitive bicupin YhaK (pirin superfamily)
MTTRTIEYSAKPPLHPGFAGPGHTAKAVVAADDFARNDPFILLMDDRIETNRELPNMGPHPHAGFETVTLVLEGGLTYHDEHGEGHLAAGDVQWMTAGSGVVHAEKLSGRVKVRILQLWLTLPKAQRWVRPAFQEIRGDALPVRREPGAEVRLYSGKSGEVISPTANHVPTTLADIRLDSGATLHQELAADWNGFLYVLSGDIRVGDHSLAPEEIGWLNRPTEKDATDLQMTAGHAGARVILYAGKMQHEPIVHYGPFVGDSQADIARSYQEFRAGKMAHINAYK